MRALVCRLLSFVIALLAGCSGSAQPAGGAELGRRLFFDRRLSVDGSLSCASCHQPERAFTDGLPVARGLGGTPLPRNTPSLANLTELRRYTWANPKLTTLAAQALVPLLARRPPELGAADAMDEVRARLARDDDMRTRFRDAFPGTRQPITTANIVAALALFEQTLRSRGAPYDRFLQGDPSALDASARRGKQLFESQRLACASCHRGPLLSDATTSAPSPYHNTGLYNLDGQGGVPRDNLGLYEFTQQRADLGKFRTPSLRNVALTAPYMHDGSVATLDEVLDHYAAGGRTLVEGPYRGVGAQSPLKDPRIAGFVLSGEERADLLAFLSCLTDPQFVQIAAGNNPFACPTRISTRLCFGTEQRERAAHARDGMRFCAPPGRPLVTPKTAAKCARRGPSSSWGWGAPRSIILNIRATRRGNMWWSGSRKSSAVARASGLNVFVLLAALLCWLGRAAAHDTFSAPEPIESAEGIWPPGPIPTHDVVVPLLVTVDETGVLRDVIVDVSVAPDLDAAAIEAGKRWRLRPATRNGVPIAGRVRIAVRFRAAVPTQPIVLDAGVLDASTLGASAPPPAADAGIASSSTSSVAAPPGPGEPRSDAGTLPAPAAPSDFGYSAEANVEATARSASEVVRDRATLSAAPHRTANDMLLVVPGLFVTQHSGEGKAYQLFYRGFDAVHGQDLEIWVGGAPVNDVSNIHGQGYADLHFLMPEVVRSVRATPGSYDPRQGDFAVAGTVRFELGYDKPGLTAKAGYGSFGSSRYFLAYRPKGADEGTFAAAEFYDTDGFGPSRAAQRASMVAQSSWRLGDQTSARLLFTAYTGHFDSAGVLRLSDIQADKVSRFATYDPNQGGASSRFQLVLELKRETADSGFSIAPYAVLRTLRLRQNYTGYLTDPNGDSQQQLNDDVVLGGTAFYRMRKRLFSAQDKFEIGVSARSDWVDQSQKRLSTADQRVTADEVDAHVRALDVAGYFDTALHPLSWLTLRGGLRIDGLSYRTVDDGAAAAGQSRASQGTHFGKKASLEVHLRPGLDVVGSYGEGFRSPQARSLAESETTPFTRVVSGELGVRYTNQQLAASAAAFRTRLSDDLVFDQSTARNELVPATLHTGATADVTYRPRPWINLNLNGTYTRAEFRESARGHQRGDLVPYAPQIVTRADLAVTPVVWEWKNRKLETQLGTGISYLARRPLPYSQLGHHIFLVDAQASVRLGELGLSLRAFNLLDSNWYDGEFLFASNWDPGQGGASLVPMRHVTVGAPRTLFASVELYL